jgi:type I restriction enzyme M protein
LFRGNAEAEIRKNLIQRGYIKGIIGLPANLFYGTGIPACIIIIDKEKASERKGLFIIDASKGFAKDGNKNRLREQDIHKIVDTFNKQIEIHKYSRFVLLKEIQEKEYNLNIPRYIDNSEDEDIHDIHAHLYGGIPSYDIDSWDEVWESFPSLKETLFQKIKGKDYYSLKVSKDEVKASVLSNADFQAFEKKISSKFLKWKKDNLERCKSLNGKSIPKQFILELSESFLGTFKNIPLIDAYDIYQHLMTYWYDTMQDDIHLIVGEGWKGGKTILKNEKTKEFEGIMLPSSLVIAQYFQKEKKAIDALITKKEETTVKLEELVEEHSTEDGLLSEAKNENDSINKNSVTNRLKKIKGNKEFKEEIALLETYLDLSGEDSELSKQIKESTKKLMDTVEVKYSSFKEEEIQKFIIEDKWFATLTSKVEEEIKRLSQKITGKITLLTEYYESPLKEKELELEKLEEKVNQHLKVMGF